MTSSSNKGKEVADLYAGLSIADDEDEGIELRDEHIISSTKANKYIVIGHFLNNKPVHFESMKNTLASIWRPVKEVTITELEAVGRYVFQFYHELDIERVLTDGPWTFNQNVLIMKRMEEEEQLLQMELNSLIIWVQVSGLPIGFQTEETWKVIGNRIGCHIERDPKNFTGTRWGYLKIKVAIDAVNRLNGAKS